VPQLTLEYTANITQQIDWSSLFTEVHHTLVHTLETSLVSCKSRIRCCDHFFIGDGAPDHAFVYLNVHVLSGHDKTTQMQLSQALMDILKRYFALSHDIFKCQLSVNVVEMDNEVYLKHTAS